MSNTPNETIKSIKITVTYESSRSKGANDFNNLKELKTWLDNHPVFAEALGYTKKK
jgi:hypothetical protein